MYYLNKTVSLVTSPAFVGLCLFVVALAAALWGRRRLSIGIACAAVAWLMFWMSPFTYRWLAGGLERQFPVRTAEEMPASDAIVVLGGGMGLNTNDYCYAEMWMSADRVWHGGRLYRAQKAPRVFVTCPADAQLLLDLGVPQDAIVKNSEARNTEEEARFLASTLKPTRENAPRPRILLVTSAWHMRRALYLFQKYAPELEVVPAATDYEALVRSGWQLGLCGEDLLPNAEMLFLNSYMIKEIIGYYGYKWLR